MYIASSYDRNQLIYPLFSDSFPDLLELREDLELREEWLEKLKYAESLFLINPLYSVDDEDVEEGITRNNW